MSNKKPAMVTIECRTCGKTYEVRKKMKERFKFGPGYFCFCTKCIPKNYNGKDFNGEM